MDSKQKRKIYTLLHNTFSFCIILSLGVITFFCIDKLLTNVNSVLWLNICLMIIAFIIFMLTIKDIISTKKLKNKYSLMIGLYLLFIFVFISYITLSIYLYVSKVNIQNYLTYLIPIILIVLCIVLMIINLFISLSLYKFIKNITVTLDSSSETPNFNDEVLLKKKLDELNRKLSIKKIQEKIDEVEKELDK